jgi:hypothetical protein
MTMRRFLALDPQKVDLLLLMALAVLASNILVRP